MCQVPRTAPDPVPARGVVSDENTACQPHRCVGHVICVYAADPDTAAVNRYA